MNRNTDKFYLNIQVGKYLIKAGNYEKLVKIYIRYKDGIVDPENLYSGIFYARKCNII